MIHTTRSNHHLREFKRILRPLNIKTKTPTFDIFNLQNGVDLSDMFVKCNFLHLSPFLNVHLSLRYYFGHLNSKQESKVGQENNVWRPTKWAIQRNPLNFGYLL